MKAGIIFIIVLLLNVSGIDARANDDEEQVTLITYYPAPFGDYNELSVKNTFLPPRMTTIERDNISPKIEGMVIYNTDTDTLEICDGNIWKSLS